MEQKKRILCVDLLRGIDIFFLLVIAYGILRPGVFSVWPLESEAAKAFWTHSPQAFAAADGHVPTGFGIFDFAQPLFIFVTGVSASLAMSRFVLPGGDRAAFWKRLARRTLMLWALGTLIRGGLTFRLFTPGDPLNFCLYSDTLHTIAVAYCAASLGLFLRRPWVRLAAGLALLAGMGIVLAVFGDYTRFGNAAYLVDEAVYSRLGGHAKSFCYLLTTFTWAGMGVLASLAGDVLRGDGAPWKKVRCLAAAGAASWIVGWALSFWIPPIRYIYTVSFAFETLGLSSLLLAALFVVTEIWVVRRGMGVLIVFGRNSLAAWMLMMFFGGALTAAAAPFVAGLPKLLGSTTYQPIFASVARMAVLVWAVYAWNRLSKRCS